MWSNIAYSFKNTTDSDLIILSSRFQVLLWIHYNSVILYSARRRDKWSSCLIRIWYETNGTELNSINNRKLALLLEWSKKKSLNNMLHCGIGWFWSRHKINVPFVFYDILFRYHWSCSFSFRHFEKSMRSFFFHSRSGFHVTNIIFIKLLLSRFPVAVTQERW